MQLIGMDIFKRDFRVKLIESVDWVGNGVGTW